VRREKHSKKEDLEEIWISRAENGEVGDVVSAT
jgi:hypothetical protein